MTQKFSSILVVSKNDALMSQITEGLSGCSRKIDAESGTLKSMNGHTREMVGKHDIVIFEADPNDPNELMAVEAASGDGKGPILVALTSDDMTISKARHLTDRGVREVLPASIDGAALRKIVMDLGAAKTASLPMSMPSTGEGRLLAVAQSTGGAGATTLAVNLAAGLARKRGKFGRGASARVALIDLDIQFGSVGTLLDLEDNGGFLDMIESSDVPDATYLKGLLQHHSSGVDVLVAPQSIVPVGAMNTKQVATLLDVLKSQYDFVVVDLPRAVVEWLEPVIERIDELYMVTESSVPAIRQTKRILDFYRETNIGLEPRVVISGEAKPMLRSEQLRAAEDLLEQRFRNWIPDDPRTARRAADLGKPAILSKTRSPLARAIDQIARDLTKRNAMRAQTHA